MLMWVKDGHAAKRRFYAKDCWCGGGGGGGGGSLDSLEAVVDARIQDPLF